MPFSAASGASANTTAGSERADSNYTEPPRPGNSIAQDRADREWRRQLAAEGIRAEPLTDEEHQALAHQRRNPGPMVPFFRQRFLAQADAELRAREAAVRDPRALRPESPHDPATIGCCGSHGTRQPRAQQARGPAHGYAATRAGIRATSHTATRLSALTLRLAGAGDDDHARNHRTGPHGDPGHRPARHPYARAAGRAAGRGRVTAQPVVVAHASPGPIRAI